MSDRRSCDDRIAGNGLPATEKDLLVQHLLAYLPLLACPVGMGLMMWMMMRVGNSQQPPPKTPPAPLETTAQQQNELQRLRAELEELRVADAHRDDVAK
jgi:hypothetical protein